MWVPVFWGLSCVQFVFVLGLKKKYLKNKNKNNLGNAKYKQYHLNKVLREALPDTAAVA